MLNNPDNLIRVDFSRKKKVTNDEIQPKSKMNPKQKVFSDMLDFGIVSVSFDPKTKGVRVPERFRRNSTLILNFSYGYLIDDFRFDDDAVSATLMFPEGEQYCSVPWDAVFSLHSEELQQSVFWDSEIPELDPISLVSDYQKETEDNPK